MILLTKVEVVGEAMYVFEVVADKHVHKVEDKMTNEVKDTIEE